MALDMRAASPFVDTVRVLSRGSGLAPHTYSPIGGINPKSSERGNSASHAQVDLVVNDGSNRNVLNRNPSAHGSRPSIVPQAA